MKSSAKTVTEYLAELPPERRKVIAAVRKVMKKNLPKGYVEVMNWGLISYEVPLSLYPETYNGQGLTYAGLAAQKNNYAVYLMVYMVPELMKKLQDGFKAAGKKLDMGKSCIRFKKLEDLPLDVIGEVVAAIPVKEYVKIYEKSRKEQKA